MGGEELTSYLEVFLLIGLLQQLQYSELVSQLFALCFKDLVLLIRWSKAWPEAEHKRTFSNFQRPRAGAEEELLGSHS